MRPTPLEQAILQAYRDTFATKGFPAVDEIEVTTRENTGAGRFVELNSEVTTHLEGRTCDLPLVVNMDGVEHGLGFVLFLDDGKLDMLELFTFTGSWDGEERAWSLQDRSGLSDA